MCRADVEVVTVPCAELMWRSLCYVCRADVEVIVLCVQG